MSDKALKLRESIDAALNEAVEEDDSELLRDIDDFIRNRNSAKTLLDKRSADNDLDDVPKKKLKRKTKAAFIPSKDHVMTEMDIKLVDGRVVKVKFQKKRNDLAKNVCPHCVFWATSKHRVQRIGRHLPIHYELESFRCLCCKYFAEENNVAKLLDAQLKQFTKIAESEAFEFADLCPIIEHLYLHGTVDESQLQIESVKLQVIKEVFPDFFVQHDHESMFGEFFEDDGDGNRGRVCNFIETTEKVTEENYHSTDRYTGSTVDAKNRSNKNGLKSHGEQWTNPFLATLIVVAFRV